MDASRFDDLTRRLATPRSRRSALRVMAGMGSGLLLVLTGRNAAADKCKANAKACSKSSQCCSGNCTPAPSSKSTSKSDSICCPATQVQLADGTCGCPAGTIDCGDGCIPGECCPDQSGYDARCNDGVGCTLDQCINNMCVHTDQFCGDGSGCRTGICDHEVGACVNIDIGGSTPAGIPGSCEAGELLANGQSCDFDYWGSAGSGLCESQYCDPASGLCAENPNPCTKQGLPCTSDSECCFGLPCTMGYCYQRA